MLTAESGNFLFLLQANVHYFEREAGYALCDQTEETEETPIVDQSVPAVDRLTCKTVNV